MPPFAGEGLKIGLKDTFTLLDHLTGGDYENIDAAITGYEQEMFVYARQAQEETAVNEARMMRPDFSFQRMYN